MTMYKMLPVGAAAVAVVAGNVVAAAAVCVAESVVTAGGI